jgi:hypothetical protein
MRYEMPGSKEAPERDGGGAGGTHHVGAVFDGLLGVKGAVLPGDALADHAGALVDEHRRRRSGGRGCGEAPRVEEARGGGPQQVRRAARGGHGAVLQAAALFPPFPTRFDLLQFFFCDASTSLSFCSVSWIHSCRGSPVIRLILRINSLIFRYSKHCGCLTPKHAGLIWQNEKLIHVGPDPVWLRLELRIGGDHRHPI